nr:hypothetical protein [Tanacetum cinerariifolium]
MINDSLRAELARCKLEIQTLERNKAKIAQPTLYDGHALLKPTNTPVRVHDSEESLVQAEKELSREQVYWLPTEELATQKSNPQKPVTPFVHTRPAPRVKPTSGASKPMSKSDTRNHSTLPAKREKARRVEDHHTNLNKQNHVDSRLNVKRTGFVSNSNTICNACNESLVFANLDNCVPTGRRFSLDDEYPLTRIVEPIIEPLKLTPCYSSNSKVTMISRFTDYKLSNRKAGSKGISDSGCSQHMTGDRSKLTNYVDKFIGTRTASIHESGTSVLEDLKALSWKTCQEAITEEENNSLPTRSGRFRHQNHLHSKMTTNKNFDGEKHCTCKKSKCLKLYCECFSAGLYCDESCTCQECFNRTDYEDTVDEARQQIVSRNPHAFSPKIDSLKQSPTNHNEDGDKRIPNAGKHKKGCNCKKSMCAKRYCECYQANVGCSSECRCEGCKNVFGKKGEYNMYNESSSTRDINKTELCTPQKLTPTPFQHSENFDMSTLDQDSPHNVEFTNQFTPPGATMMDWPNSSRVSSVNSLHWPGSIVTPAAVTSPDNECMIVQFHQLLWEKPNHFYKTFCVDHVLLGPKA